MLKYQQNPDWRRLTGSEYIQCARETDPEFLDFFGQLSALLTEKNSTWSFESPCFKNNTFVIDFDDAKKEITVNHHTTGHKNFICGDGIILSIMSNYHVEAVYLDGHHKYVFKDLT
mmetsp:Transcript_10082/g.8602  ORF Transcript_10082/g.8602 Transcript_10082/m.8602 type:complete len:116 (-) Transcript_10082:325-672(-)